MNNNMYSDREMQWGAQIGYCNFTDSDMSNYKEREKGYPTLKEILHEK